jgi:hypothetical protein
MILNAYLQGSACYANEERGQRAKGKISASRRQGGSREIEDRVKQAERKRRER